MVGRKNDHTIELHSQGSLRYGCSIACYFLSCDAYLNASRDVIYCLDGCLMPLRCSFTRYLSGKTWDQGYVLFIENVAWMKCGSQVDGDGMVLSVHEKSITIWDRHSAGLFAYKTLDMIYVHILIFSACCGISHSASDLIIFPNRRIQMGTY